MLLHKVANVRTGTRLESDPVGVRGEVRHHSRQLVLRPIRFGIAKKRVKVRRSVRRVGRNLLDARLDQLAVLDLAARLDVDSVQLAHTGENKGLGAVELLCSGV